MSTGAADMNEMERARQLGRRSMWISVAGIVINVVIFIILIADYATHGINIFNLSESKGPVFHEAGHPV